MRKILILKAVSDGLNLDDEIRNIEESIRRASRTKFDVRVRTAVQQKDIRRAIQEEHPAVVHFCGHGTSEGNLIVENDSKGTIPLYPEGLARLFKFHKHYVKCVLINTCYSELAAKAVSEHISYTIGMNCAIHDHSAISFSEAFYDALGYELRRDENEFERAFEEGVTAISMVSPRDTGTPTLKKKLNVLNA